MKKILLLFLLIISAFFKVAYSQTPFSEGVITYDLKIEAPSQQRQQMANMMSGSSLVWSIKGPLSKKDIQLGKVQNITITDMRDTTAVSLIETEDKKYLIHLNKQEIMDYMQRRYKGVNFKDLPQTKTIAGYKCNKAEGTLPDGKKITVYYASSLAPDNEEYLLQFRNLKGFPLEFETYIKGGKIKMTATATTINLNTVPASTFDIPSTGYREITPQELHSIMQ